jgi:hypothetical protein
MEKREGYINSVHSQGALGFHAELCKDQEYVHVTVGRTNSPPPPPPPRIRLDTFRLTSRQNNYHKEAFKATKISIFCVR